MKAKCLNPVTAWICGVVCCKSDGVISPNIVFSWNEAFDYYSKIYGSSATFEIDKHSISMPCGKCMACQIEKRKAWTTRLSNEASLYDGDCCFITLTYDDEHIPCTNAEPFLVNDDSVSEQSNIRKEFGRGKQFDLYTLHVPDVQKFVKRLRRYLEYLPAREKNRVGRDHVETPIRYYAVGEYGSKFGRPHYHLLIFGWKPSDMQVHSVRNGIFVYRSAQIEKLWKYGFSTVEPVQGGVAKYCSRYVTKKFARLQEDNPFKGRIVPEFFLQSVRNGGIGAPYVDRYYREIFARGFVNVRANDRYVKCAIPAYYKNRLRKLDLRLWLDLREERIAFIKENPCVVGLDDLIRKCQVYEHQEKQARQFELF